MRKEGNVRELWDENDKERVVIEKDKENVEKREKLKKGRRARKRKGNGGKVNAEIGRMKEAEGMKMEQG